MLGSDDSRVEYLASGSGSPPRDHERLDLIREVLGEAATWAEPPQQVADGILAAVAHDHTGLVGDAPLVPQRRWPVVAAVVGSAAAVVALVFSTISVLDTESETVLAMTGTEIESGASGQATVRPTDAGWWIRLDVRGLPPAPQGTYYEGWVWSDEGDGVSIGTFHLRGGEDPVILWSGVEMADYPSIWVTLENEDEGPETSDLVVLTGRMPDAPDA